MLHHALSTLASLIQFLGSAQIPGDACDGLELEPAILEDGTPHCRMGGFGSALTYTGIDATYLATPDRGPADGATSWHDRAYLLDIRVEPDAAAPVSMSLLAAIPLVDEAGAALVGTSSAFDAAGSAASPRLDPEGVRVSPRGTFYVSDEYGPYLYEVDAGGRRIGVLPVPEELLIASPGATAAAELPPFNTSGRQSNRGMEGLAISPDGRRLIGILQNALLQDHALDAANRRRGLYNRILDVDVATGASRQYVYPLNAAGNGVNELLAVDDHRFLVLERDGLAGAQAAFKRIFLIDLDGATDVSAVASLPQSDPLPAGIAAVAKAPFLDLLDPGYGLAGADFPEKIEGLAWAPDLADGRHVLLVSTDNDLRATAPSRVWAFAIPDEALAGVERAILAPAVVVQPWDRRHRVWPRLGLPTPVAILSEGLLDATAIEPSTVRLAGAAPLRVWGVPLCFAWDLDADGDDDLVCVVDGGALALQPGDTRAPLVAATTTATPVRSEAAVTAR